MGLEQVGFDPNRHLDVQSYLGSFFNSQFPLFRFPNSGHHLSGLDGEENLFPVDCEIVDFF